MRAVNSVGPILDGAKGIFGKVKDAFMARPKEARMLAVAGAGNFVLGGGGFMSKILDLAGIACLFVPVLMPFIAAAYLIRGAWQLVKGVFCLLKGDFKGFLGNLAAGALNIVCALPFGRVGKAVEAFKKVSASTKATSLTARQLLKGSNAAVKELYGNDIAKQFRSSVIKAMRWGGKFRNTKLAGLTDNIKQKTASLINNTTKGNPVSSKLPSNYFIG